MPCHRSHIDYLLLSYAIYYKGYAVPHVAAGINLNMPVLGRFIRKGGAFYIRRSFKGNTLYTMVFMKYLGLMMARGHSIEFFIEGGRSRTGRLLQPKTGMLSMTLRSYLRDPRRPVVFLPVYFGYERLVEGKTYIGELSGAGEREGVGVHAAANAADAAPALRQGARQLRRGRAAGRNPAQARARLAGARRTTGRRGSRPPSTSSRRAS